MNTDTNDLPTYLPENDPLTLDLHSIFMQAPALMCVFEGPNHVYKFVNPPYQALLGNRPLIGRPIAEAVPELEGQPIFGLLDNVYRTGESFHAQEMLVQLDHDNSGKGAGRNYYNFVYQATRSQAGEITGVLVFAYEVTAQVEAKQKVQELNEDLNARVQERTRQLEMQKSLLSEILGQVPAFIATLEGPDHRYTFFNESYQRLSGNRTKLGLTVAEVFPEVVEQGFTGLLDKVYATGEPFVGIGTPAMLYDESTGKPEQRYVDFVYQPLKNSKGETHGILAFILDVTDKFTAKKELEEANRRLVATNADLDNFIYTASHDLKAPILNIEGLVTVLLEDLSSEVLNSGEIGSTISLIQRSVYRFKATLEHLTDVIRLQHGDGGEAAMINLNNLVSDVLLDLDRSIKEAEADIEVDTELCPPIMFSLKNLRSIIFNLLSNAIKYRSPERPLFVQIRCRTEEDNLVLTVQDNGLGIDLKKDNRLFTLFSRLHDHVEGSGIGLFMTKKIIENAGGKIEVDSKVNEGSTFSVFLPINVHLSQSNS